MERVRGKTRGSEGIFANLRVFPLKVNGGKAGLYNKADAEARRKMMVMFDNYPTDTFTISILLAFRSRVIVGIIGIVFGSVMFAVFLDSFTSHTVIGKGW